MTDETDDTDDTDEELPEAIRLHKALAITCLALELIAEGSLPGKQTAAATLAMLRRDHPDVAEHLTKPGLPPGSPDPAS